MEVWRFQNGEQSMEAFFCNVQNKIHMHAHIVLVLGKHFFQLCKLSLHLYITDRLRGVQLMYELVEYL